MKLLPIAVMIVGCLMVAGGLLHDYFILRSEHGKAYTRELLRLLMDGHILITCGAMQLIAVAGLYRGEHWAFYVAGAASISLLIYCALIFPFLRSYFTIILNLIILGLMIYTFK